MFKQTLGLCLIGCLSISCDDGDTSSSKSADGLVDISLTDGAVNQTADAGMDESRLELDTLVDEVDMPLQFGMGTIEFEVAEHVLSLTVIVYGASNGWYGIDSWTNGDGTSLVTADWPTFEGNERGCFTCANFAAQSQGASTTIAPNRPSAIIAPGIHRVSVVGWVDGLSADTVSVRVIAKTGTALPSSGVVDLNFYLTGAQGWDTSSIQADPYFAASIARVNDLYGRVGIEIGEMTFHDIDSSFAVISIAPDDTDLGDLVSESTLDQTAGINIFFVDEILTGEADYPSIPGVSASVPNPPYLPGTVASGVAIALSGPLSVPPNNRFLDPPAIGQTLCHELGHALGLYHTSEYDLISHDIYDDTAENDNGLLMHADGVGDFISTQQADAMFANPVIRHPRLGSLD